MDNTSAPNVFPLLDTTRINTGIDRQNPAVARKGDYLPTYKLIPPVVGIWAGFFVLLLYVMFARPVFAVIEIPPQVEVIASNLWYPNSILVDADNVYWNERYYNPSGGSVCGIAKKKLADLHLNLSPTYYYPPHCDTVLSSQDMAQDSQYIYFPIELDLVKPEDTYLIETLCRVPKSNFSPMDDLLDYDFENDGYTPDGVGTGFIGFLTVRNGNVYFVTDNFWYREKLEIYRVPSGGTGNVNNVILLADISDFSQLVYSVTGLETDNSYVYWIQATSFGGSVIRRVPQSGDTMETIATLLGLATSLVVHSTIDGTYMFWLEVDLDSSSTFLKMRNPQGQISVLVQASPSDQGSVDIPSWYSYATRALAVDDTYVYFFRHDPSGDDHVARVPFKVGADIQVFQYAKVINPMAIAVDKTHVYWTDFGISPGLGTVKRVPKPRKSKPWLPLLLDE